MSARFPVVRSREVIRVLEKSGFFISRTSGSHCRLIHRTDPTRMVTVPIYAGRDIKTGTLRSIIRQAGMTVEEFTALL